MDRIETKYTIADSSLPDLTTELLNVDFTNIKIETAKIHPDSDSLFQFTKQKVVDELGPEFKLSKDISDFSFYVFPSVSFDVAVGILVYNMAAFILDDYLDKYPEGTKVTIYSRVCHLLFHSTESNVVVQQIQRKDFPGDTINDKWWRLTIKVCTEAFGANALDQLFEFFIMCISKAVEVNEIWTGSTDLSDKEFLELRCVDSGAPHEFYLALIGSGKSYTDELKTDPNYIGLNKQTAIHVSLINELYSLRKEIRAGSYRYNYVYVKMKNHNITAQEAVNEIIVEINEAHRMAHFYGERLKESDDPKLSRYVDAMYEVMTGNHYWSTFCKRYNGA